MNCVETHRFAFTFPSIRNDPQGAPLLSWQDGIQRFDSELDLDTNPEAHLVRTAADVFTADERDRVMEIGNAPPQMGGVAEDHRRERHRASQVAWIKDKAW